MVNSTLSNTIKETENFLRNATYSNSQVSRFGCTSEILGDLIKNYRFLSLPSSSESELLRVVAIPLIYKSTW